MIRPPESEPPAGSYGTIVVVDDHLMNAALTSQPEAKHG